MAQNNRVEKMAGRSPISKDLSPKSRPALKPISLLIIAALIGAVWLLSDTFKEILLFVADKEAFSAYINQFGMLGPIVLGVFIVFQVVVAMIPGHAFVIAAGYLYGLLPGFLFSFLNILFGSIIAFFLARIFGRPLVVKLVPASTLDKWDNATEEHGLLFFLTSFLLPIFPADTMTFLAGLSPISLKKFIVANLGRIPATILFVAVGVYGLEIAALEIPLWIWVVFLGVSILTYWLWQYFFHTYRKRRVDGKQKVSEGPS